MSRTVISWLLVERLHDRRADLPRADEEDPHERVAYSGIGALQPLATVARAHRRRRAPGGALVAWRWPASAQAAESAFRKAVVRARLRQPGAR